MGHVVALTEWNADREALRNWRDQADANAYHVDPRVRRRVAMLRDVRRRSRAGPDVQVIRPLPQPYGTVYRPVPEVVPPYRSPMPFERAPFFVDRPRSGIAGVGFLSVLGAVTGLYRAKRARDAQKLEARRQKALLEQEQKLAAARARAAAAEAKTDAARRRRLLTYGLIAGGGVLGVLLLVVLLRRARR